ncbi:MAG: S-layer homology domain-containing protein [Oscillospiraceae bacterium]
MKKRVLAALLALVMLFGALPMSVFAEDLETVEEPSGTFEPDEPEKYTYHLYYDFNYVGTGSTKWNIEYGPTADTSYTYTVDSQTLTCREGYNFLGWADGKNATEPDYRGGDTITLTWQNPTKTIYAVWKEKTQPQPDITDPTDFAKTQYVPLQCKDNANHRIEKLLEGLPEDAWEVEWTPGSKEATLKLYPAKIAPLYTMGGEHKAVDESTVTVTLAYTNRWSIAGRIPAIPAIKITCAAPVIPDPTEFIGIKTVPVQCNNKADHYMQYAIDGLIEKKCAELVWSTGSKEATLKLYPEKIANRFSALKGTHTAVSTSVVTVTLTYNGSWKIDGAIPVIYVTCAAPEIPDPTDSVKDQYVTVVCDDKTAHPNIQYLLENLPAGSVDVQWDGAAKTAKLVLKPDKIAEHYGMAYGVHTAVNPADVEVSLTYVNDAWSLSAAIPDVHVTCKPAQEIPNPNDSFNKLLVNVACNTENSGHDPIEVPLSAVANSVNVRWEPGTATAYITLTPSIFATYYSQHNNGANGAHDPVAPAAVTVEAHYDNEKGWFWTKPTINVKCEPVYTITYNWRGVVKPADVKNVNNPGTFTADELPITLKAPDFKNNEWPQKFLNWRDAAGNVVTQITEPGNVELYAYYQFPVKYTVYDENDQKVDELSVTEWYNEDDFAAYSLRSGEKTGHDFDGWYQNTKDFGNTNKRVTKLNMAKKWELVGKLTRKEYTVTASLFLNGSEEATKDARGVVISRSVKGLYGDPINYDGENGLNAQLKEAALAADAANEPNPDYVDINICLNDKSGKPFDAETYGQEGYNWRDMQWQENKWIVAYAWAYVDTYYDVTFNVNMEGVTPVDTQTVKCKETATAPAAPTKEGYKFLGWFEKDAAEPFDFDTQITQKTELTAKWELNLQTVNVVIYRNGDMTKAFKTVPLEKQPKGTVIDLTTLDIANYYTANSTGKYDFYGWYNDGEWNNYKANPENPPAGLQTITVNGWTNIICMVYDYEKVIVKAITDDNKATETQLFSGMARRGSNLLDYLAAQNIELDKVGHTHDEWYKYDSPKWKFGENDTINGWTNVLVKYARKEYTVVAKMYLDGAPHFRQNTDFYTYQVTGLYGDPINFASIKEQAIAQAEKDRPASASYDASVIEDWAGNATCTTFGEHQPDLDTPHYVNVHVNTTQHVYVYRMIDGKMEATEYHHSTAPFGANVVEHLNANVTNLDMSGYSHDEWFKKDVPALDVKFGDTDTINGWTNVVIKYTKNEFPVTYDYACTDPALVPNWKVWETLPENSYTYAPGESVRVAMMPDDVEDGEYIWKFVTWKLNGVDVVPNAQVPMVEGGLTFVGIWERTQKEYGVTYDYACTDPALVPNWKVWATLPENKDTYTVGQKVTTAAKPDDVEDGEYIWKFVTWKLGDTEVAPNTQVEMVAGGLTFVGIWEHTQKEYGVTYSYDPSLPAEVQATIPKDPDTYTVGQKVTTAAKPNSVRVGENIWTFKTWKLDGVEVAPNTQVEMVAGGLTFVGIWEHTQKEYGVTYSYDPSLPAEVQATIPKDPDTYTVGQKVTTAAKPNSVRVGENIWTFKTWKLDGVEVAPNTQVDMVSGGLHFEGIWETKLIHYSLTIQYVDKKGKELAESHMDLLAKGEAYKVDSPKIKGYKLKDKDDAVIEGTMPGRNLTIEVVYIKKSTGGGSGTIDSPNKPTTKAPALTLNTDDHFAFINGYPDGSVQPEGNVTRAETAAILYRIMGDACQSYYKTNSSSYSDVARGDWYNTYVATLENAGVIVDTRTNGKFRPNDAITRAELASMIAQFAGLESASAAKFNDVGSRYWAAEEIAIAAKMGWINGYPDGSFRPDRNVTRAELMAMVNRALGRTPKSEDDLLSGMKTWRDNANVNAWYYLDVQEATNDHTYTKSGTHETWKKLL